MISDCPCGSKLSYEKCCGAFLDAKQSPQTPEKLMRSRYTAFTKASIDYLMQTMRGQALQDFRPDFTRQWTRQVQWLGLKVLQAPRVADGENVGWVEFIATYKESGEVHEIHELSEFHRADGRWYYVGGKHKGEQKPYVRKIQRNDPCACGSGKKYKNCCEK